MTTPPICYFSHGGIITQVNDQRPCASTANGPSYCCTIGDFCEGDNICHFTHPNSVLGAVYSSYYMGGCTDLSYGNSTVCTTHCTTSDSSGSGRQTDVVYNSTSNQWACCGATINGPHCDAPTNEVFEARAPSAMTNTVSLLSTGIPTNGPSTSTSTSTTISTTTTISISTTTPTATQSTDSGLPSGTKTGIGIGVAIGVLAVIALIVILLFTRRKHQRRLEAARRSEPSTYRPSQPGSTYGPSPGSQYGIPMGDVDPGKSGAMKRPEHFSGPRQEMGGQENRPWEMDAIDRPVELDADGMRPR